jgi:hypothetical protein
MMRGRRDQTDLSWGCSWKGGSRGWPRGLCLSEPVALRLLPVPWVSVYRGYGTADPV